MENEEKNTQKAEETVKNEEQIKADKEAFEEALYAAPDEDDEEEAEKPKKKKKGRYGPISIILLVICAGVFVYSMTNILKLTPNDFSTKSIIDELKQEGLKYDEEYSYIYNDIDNPEQHADDPNDPSSQGQDKKKTAKLVLDETDGSISFLARPLSATKNSRNADITAWLFFPDVAGAVSPGLTIDTAVVKYKDNDYYLSHDLEKKENENGWIFFDSNCDGTYLTNNRNTILYGHARSDNMFGGLKYLNEKPKWYENKSNHYIRIQTESQDTIWQIFAWYETNVDDEVASGYNYITKKFPSDEYYVEFLNRLQSKNMIDSFTRFEFDADDKILTLSTCKTYDKAIRVVIHAKLVKLRIWE